MEELKRRLLSSARTRVSWPHRRGMSIQQLGGALQHAVGLRELMEQNPGLRRTLDEEGGFTSWAVRTLVEHTEDYYRSQYQNGTVRYDASVRPPVEQQTAPAGLFGNKIRSLVPSYVR